MNAEIERLQQTAALFANPAEVTASDLEIARENLKKSMRHYASFDGSLKRMLVGDIPWRVWAEPMFLWGGLILLTYIVLMSFNILIFRQWAYNERLIYPLAELPEILAGLSKEDKEDPGHVLPATYRNGLFWCGFAISATFMGYNLLAASNILPQLAPLDFRNSWSPYLQGSPL